MVTSLCKRDCKYCCNKQYDLNSIPYVTDEELERCHTLCLTGGEPFAFTNPEDIAFYYKMNYPNIKNVYVYSNAVELIEYLAKHGTQVFWSIDGLNVSIKYDGDLNAFETLVGHPSIERLKENQLYVFNDLLPENTGNFKVIKREWQPEFIPADDSIFRKV